MSENVLLDELDGLDIPVRSLPGLQPGALAHLVGRAGLVLLDVDVLKALLRVSTFPSSGSRSVPPSDSTAVPPLPYRCILGSGLNRSTNPEMP